MSVAVRAIVIATSLCVSAAFAERDLAVLGRLLPAVQTLDAREGAFALPDPIVIATASTATDATRHTAGMLADDLRAATNRMVELQSTPRGASAITLAIESGDDPQAYRLSVGPHGVVITGAGEPGLFYGTRTLLQLLEAGTIPGCDIADRPDYEHRMVLYDLAREQTFNLAYMKHVIDVLAAYKINMLHLYLENRFQYASHPDISPPNVMTPAQARQLDAYARTKFVELVPEINCLAHLENVLSIPKYRHLAEEQDRPYEICTQNPEAVAFVQDMVRDVTACFSTSYFHMGGDEAFAMGTCPKCADRIKADGGKQGLFCDYYTHMAAFIRSLGKRPMMWGDMLLAHRGVAERMPKDIIVFDWHYGDSSAETVRYFTAQGFETYVCPALSGFARFAAPYQHATRNIDTFIRQGKEGGATGQCTCVWECRMGHIYASDYWGVLLAADRSWNVDAGDLADYEKRFCRVFFGLDDRRAVQYHEQLSDGYSAIYGAVLQSRRSIVAAYSPLDRDREQPYAKHITAEMLAQSDRQLARLTDMLNDLRASVTRNRDALAFADIPAHSTHMALRRFAFASQMFDLVEQAKEDGETDPAAAEQKLRRAIELLGEINKDLAYLERRYQEAAAQIGASVVDPVRIQSMRSDIAGKIEEIKTLMNH